MRDAVSYLRRGVCRLPFTLTTLAILVVVGLVTNTHVGRLPAFWLHRVGFSPRNLLLFNWERLLGSALVTHGDWVFWRALAMVALAVGIAEWRVSTRRTAVTFWGVHVSVLLVLSLAIALPLHWLGVSLGTSIVMAREVGPSAGYFGCLGLVVGLLKSPWQRIAGAAVVLALFASLLFLAPLEHSAQAIAIKLEADIAHLLAFPLGWLSLRVRPGESGWL